MMLRKEVVLVYFFVFLLTKTTQSPLNPDRLNGITDALFFYKEHLLKYYFDKYLHIHQHHHHYHHRVPNYDDLENNEMELQLQPQPQDLLEEYSNLGDSDKIVLLEEISQEIELEQQNLPENNVGTPSLEEIDKIILESLKQDVFATNATSTTPSTLSTQETPQISTNNNQTIPTTNPKKTQNTYEVYEDVKE